ncbi:glycosyltransferase family 4 protein [Geomonas paludis]|uniref:Glycosyltransferase WbpH n=1 Tax=Geomonas paludis TaxID=2740185 RepID=A0A6V8MUG3_9BACT|nr:glycosyltransferase family 4 protein [Geomonas paludis]GFO63828.1 glycosyltransferase WbpH [Geomonas paludis]
MKVVHLTSAHDKSDSRIFLKMCRSLAQAGLDVHLVVPCPEGERRELRDGVTVHPVPLPKNRYHRNTTTVRQVLEVAGGLGADLYHFHDPDFLHQAPSWQRRLQRPFVYDAHEDYRAAICDKAWIHPLLRSAVSRYFGFVEDRAVKRLGGVVAATPTIAARFARMPRVETIFNYPLAHELATPGAGGEPGHFVYIGDITAERGVREMVRAVPLAGPQARLLLAGRFNSQELHEECRSYPQWQQVEECGFLDRKGVSALLSRACAGLVVLHPLDRYRVSLPIKLFEYMSCGLPVIASDFPLWREIVQGAGCGLLVDPLDPESIAAAMRSLAERPDAARAMGEKGRQAVLARYNWESEITKLLRFYDQVRGRFPAQGC